jgi:4-hydroxy-3-methylbut-2-en-1-yl diphosphate reductase
MKSFNIPELYKSQVISKIKENRRVKDRLKKDFSPSILKFGSLEILISRHFGFCYGVENAVEIAYKTIESNPEKRVFLLSEMIHNPEVNNDLLSRGLNFLMDTKGNRLMDWSELRSDDAVIVPAFGTTVEIQKVLEDLNIDPYKYDTTCPFVEKVWNRAAQIGERGFTIIVHGKPTHEETRATFSHSKENSPTLIINDLSEARILSKYIRKEISKAQFYIDFENRYSQGFDPEIHLEKIGVVNQTTMLANETQEISDFLKKEIVEYYGLQEFETEKHFANTRDTLCYATNDNQEATYALLNEPADIAIVVGGYNSSNTSHLVELCENKLRTFFIKNQDNLIDRGSIRHFDMHLNEEIETKNYLPSGIKKRIMLTCGASCPDSVIEQVLLKIINFYDTNLSSDDVLLALEN